MNFQFKYYLSSVVIIIVTIAGGLAQGFHEQQASTEPLSESLDLIGYSHVFTNKYYPNHLAVFMYFVLFKLNYK